MQGRKAYETGVKNLSARLQQLRSEGKSIEDIARTMSAERRELGRVFKEKTPEKLADYIRERNLQVYGDELGPTVDFLRSRGKTWEQIAESSARPGGLDIDFIRFAFE